MAKEAATRRCKALATEAGHGRKAESLSRSLTATTTAAMSNQQNSALLHLPAETRNTIYRYALIEPDTIEVLAGETKPPPLLATCRQIRTEAMSIWVNENVFQFTLRDCDATLYVAWQKHMLKYDGVEPGGKSTSWLTRMRGRPSWENLFAWCKALFNIEGCYLERRVDDFQGDRDMRNVVASAHEIVQTAWEKYMSWKTTERLLEALHLALKSVDHDWE